MSKHEMNLFFLNRDVKQACKEHCNAHVCKMIIEYAQLLSTAHHQLDGEEVIEGLYRKTHVNHPCAIWVRDNSANYSTAYKMFKYLAKEYTYRYGKVHLTEKKLKKKLRNLPLRIKFKNYATMPPQCMPDEYKVEGDPFQAYRNYYRGEKRCFAKWTKRPTPKWFVE